MASNRAEYATSSSHSIGGLEAAILSSSMPMPRLARRRSIPALRAAEAHQGSAGQIVIVSARPIDAGRMSTRNAAYLLEPRHSPGLAVEAMHMRPGPVRMSAVRDGLSAAFVHSISSVKGTIHVAAAVV